MRILKRFENYIKEDLNEMQKEILNDIKRIEINCPECEWMDDDQYTCTTCWCEGGDGKINVYEWLRDHPNSFTKN
jgi:hypothetical protein